MDGVGVSFLHTRYKTVFEFPNRVVHAGTNQGEADLYQVYLLCPAPKDLRAYRLFAFCRHFSRLCPRWLTLLFYGAYSV